MKKNYINPATIIIELDTETIIAVSTNVHTLDDGTGSYILGSDIKGSATSADGEMDAAGYRSNLWND